MPKKKKETKEERRLRVGREGFAKAAGNMMIQDAGEDDPEEQSEITCWGMGDWPDSASVPDTEPGTTEDTEDE